MEVELDIAPMCLKTNKDGSRLVVGCVDGSVRFYDTSAEVEQQGALKEIWRFVTKSSVRGVEIDDDLKQVYAVTKNRALCVFDMETGRRIRCILKCHSDVPSAMCVLPPTALKNQQLATADESGEVKTWDLRANEPVVRKWKQQEEEINDLKLDCKHNLIASSSDGTLAAYDLRKGKFKVRSEAMHSELSAICPTNKYTYVGGQDGFVEVFDLNEYGNILERIESGYEMGVNGIVELRLGLLLLSSNGSNKLKLLNVMPSKRLGAMGSHGEDDIDGIDVITISQDKSTVFSAVSMNCSIKKWNLAPIVGQIPILRAQDAKKKKGQVAQGFFDDLVGGNGDEPKSKRQKTSEAESGEDQDEEESGVDSDDEEIDDEEDHVIDDEAEDEAEEEEDDEDVDE
ncbi:unnamed protein product [Caenorhabditis angaria]|uniref:Uncharacterized protein n=1 Tax=Caenorhabditis angaria TaxID=860376 RepID=A0A9P1IMC1_9PELO|nr:unnamed protein product [Caenorhabditis angaria]